MAALLGREKPHSSTYPHMHTHTCTLPVPPVSQWLILPQSRCTGPSEGSGWRAGWAWHEKGPSQAAAPFWNLKAGASQQPFFPFRTILEGSYRVLFKTGRSLGKISLSRILTHTLQRKIQIRRGPLLGKTAGGGD